MPIKSRMAFDSNMLESSRRSGFVCFPVLTVNRKNANHVVPLCKLRPSTSVLKFIVSDSAWVYVSTVPAFAGRGIEKWCAGSRRVCVYGVRSRHVCECIFVCVCVDVNILSIVQERSIYVPRCVWNIYRLCWRAYAELKIPLFLR